MTFTLPARPNRPSRPVVLTVRAERVTLHPKGGEPVTVTALRAREESAPVGVEPLDGRLLSNRPADTLTPAAEWIQWYASRWSIEVFFRILKTGCRVEALPLSTLDRLEPALALYLIIAWRIQYLTLLGRTTPELPCDAVLDPAEGQAVYVAIHHQSPPIIPPRCRPCSVGSPASAAIWAASATALPAPKPSGSACSALATSPGECNWRLISMPHQPVRYMCNRQP
ncbi:MAG: transposase [Candidatus Competibacteraceae bacterium]|nr:transposase [Candidatus Competibacteraceae bacterium]